MYIYKTAEIKNQEIRDYVENFIEGKKKIK